MARRAGIRITDRDLGWRRLGRALRDASVSAVEVGAHADAPARREGGPTNAQIYAWQEYGTTTIPKRSSLRATFDKQWPVYRAAAGVLGRKVMLGVLSKRQALAVLGAKFASDVKATIRAYIPPPLADVTIERKGSSTPLIDTSQLIGAIRAKVVK